TLDGSGTVTNGPDSQWALVHSTIRPVLDNQGYLEARSGVDLTNTFSNDAGATLRVVGDGTGTVSFQVLRVASGFVNHGLIEITGTNPNYYSSLGVTTGTLVNAPDGTLHTLVGGGGGRNLNAELDNQGMLLVDQGLVVSSQPGQAHRNSGTITLVSGDLDFNAGNSSNSFTNTGGISIAADRTLAVQFNSMSFYQNGGSISGPGTLFLNGVAAHFAGDFVTNDLNLFLQNYVTLTSPGTLTISAGTT